MNVHHSKLYWDKDQKTLAGEASDLGMAPGTWPLFIRVTGKHSTVYFVRSDMRVDQEGDLTHVIYRPDVTESVNVLGLVIFND